MHICSKLLKCRGQVLPVSSALLVLPCFTFERAESVCQFRRLTATASHCSHAHFGFTLCPCLILTSKKVKPSCPFPASGHCLASSRASSSQPWSSSIFLKAKESGFSTITTVTSAKTVLSSPQPHTHTHTLTQAGQILKRPRPTRFLISTHCAGAHSSQSCPFFLVSPFRNDDSTFREQVANYLISHFTWFRPTSHATTLALSRRLPPHTSTHISHSPPTLTPILPAIRP